jgi:hypothetical protein
MSAVASVEPGNSLLTGASNVQVKFTTPESRTAYESWAATKLITSAHERAQEREAAKEEAAKEARKLKEKAINAEHAKKSRGRAWASLKQEMVQMAVQKSRDAIQRASEKETYNEMSKKKVEEWTAAKIKMEREKLKSRGGRRRRSVESTGRKSAGPNNNNNTTGEDEDLFGTDRPKAAVKAGRRRCGARF